MDCQVFSSMLLCRELQKFPCHIVTKITMGAFGISAGSNLIASSLSA
jgi:hypothetical protein